MQTPSLPTNFGDPTSVLHTSYLWRRIFPRRASGVMKWGGPQIWSYHALYLLTETETDGLLLCGGFQYDSVTVSEKDRSTYAYQ